MASRISSRARTALLVLGVLGIAALGFILGGMVLGGGTGESATMEGPGAPMAGAPDAALSKGNEGVGQSYGGAPSLVPEEAQKRSGGDATTAGIDAMLIKNSNLEVRVDKIEPALDSIRQAARKHGATITELSVTGGSDPGPRPLAESSGSFPSPAYASVILRVDAEKLDALEADVAKVGKVLTQGSSASDVTQEYVDLSARLKNLQATEARLRSFTARANKVSDLLQIEAELTRVRGEIEAMQAQVDYLKRQTARATLNVQLSEPGPLVQPSGADWGFGEAIRRGIQAAATLITGLITLLIAVLPILAALGVAWFVYRVRRRNRVSSGTDETDVRV